MSACCQGDPGADLRVRPGAAHLQGAPQAALPAAGAAGGGRQPEPGGPAARRPRDRGHALGRPRLALARLRALGPGEPPHRGELWLVDSRSRDHGAHSDWWVPRAGVC